MTNAKKRCISLPLIAFCVLLIFSGCDSPGGFDDPQEGYGVITVSIDDEFARTIYPLVEFARYDYFFAKVINGKTRDFEKQVPVEGVFTLELGDWQVRVDVYATEDDPYPAATGTSVIFNVSREGIKQVKIQLTGNEKSGYGSFSYYITYPAGTTIDTFELKPYPPTPENIIIDLLPASNSGIRTNIPAGCYSITIFLSNTEGKAGASDAVYILEKLESAYGTAAKPIVFTERNFIKPTGTPVAADFDFGNLAQVAGTGVQPVTVTPRDGKSTGAITILYDGSQTLPTTAGTYTVTFNVAASPNWYAEYNLSAPPLALVPESNVININYDGDWNGLAANSTIVPGTSATAPNNYLVNVNTNVSATGTTVNTFDNKQFINVFINGNNKEISLSGSDVYLLRIGDKQNVTMNNLTLKGHIGNNANLVYMNDDCNFTMNSGAIRDNGNSGVFMDTEGTFTMNGGTISNNTTYVGGGGVCNDIGTFIMNGGTISENKASDGGGVYNYGTFIMNGGTISENETTSNGGGVVVGSPGGTFIMNGGTISENDTGNSGGGVYVTGSNSKFTMNDGTITGNTATNNGDGGGGVYVQSGTFIMDGGTISHNDVGTSGGGGVVVENGTFTMTGGTISHNDAGNGGGVVVGGPGCTFNMNGGTISHNDAGNGGGVYAGAGVFTMNGGTISGNTATATDGGGVSVDGGTFQITKGTVYGNGEGALSNTANRYGAVLYIYSGTARYGTGGGSWTDIPLIGNARDATIRVVDGVLK